MMGAPSQKAGVSPPSDKLAIWCRREIETHQHAIRLFVLPRPGPRIAKYGVNSVLGDCNRAVPSSGMRRVIGGAAEFLDALNLKKSYSSSGQYIVGRYGSRIGNEDPISGDNGMTFWLRFGEGDFAGYHLPRRPFFFGRLAIKSNRPGRRFISQSFGRLGRDEIVRGAAGKRGPRPRLVLPVVDDLVQFGPFEDSLQNIGIFTGLPGQLAPRIAVRSTEGF